MARTTIARQTIANNSGGATTPTAADSGNGMQFPNDGHTALGVMNASGAPITVTVKSVPCSHGRSGDIALTIPAGQQGWAPRLDPTLFNQPATSMVYVDFSASASVTVEALQTV